MSSLASLFLRITLFAAFVSAVADRFGLWGAPGAPNVFWGDFAAFTSYTAFLNPWAPSWLVDIFAWAATILEVVFGIGLLVGWQTRIFAALSGALLLVFGLTMVFALGIKAPLDYSVFTASAGAFLLATYSDFKWSIDEVLSSN